MGFEKIVSHGILHDLLRALVRFGSYVTNVMHKLFITPPWHMSLMVKVALLYMCTKGNQE